MSEGTSGWRSDTLSKRLFILLWVTLVASHALGFWLVHPQDDGPGHRALPHGEHADDMGHDVLPPFLPPGGLAGGPDHGGGPGDGHSPRAEGHPGLQPYPSPDGGYAPPHDHHAFAWLEYLARVLVLGLAAWLGARWLTAPLRRLTHASQALSRSMGQSGDLPLLDDKHGPLEVRQTARVFNDMAINLRDQFAQRGLMMAAVSHDLRTPLTRLRMRLETLLPDPVAQRSVTDVQDINSLIDAVLDAMNEERRQEALQTVDVLAMVHAMADDLQEAGQVVMAGGDEATLRVQPVAFKRVLSNLVNNALRYGHSADIRVALAPGKPQGQVRITIDDKGPGIPPAQLDAVFKPFVRLDASRSRDTGGVGLGLYIARELVHRHGGTITLRNLPEGGLRAEITLPQI